MHSLLQYRPVCSLFVLCTGNLVLIEFFAIMVLFVCVHSAHCMLSCHYQTVALCSSSSSGCHCLLIGAELSWHGWPVIITAYTRVVLMSWYFISASMSFVCGLLLLLLLLLWHDGDYYCCSDCYYDCDCGCSCSSYYYYYYYDDDDDCYCYYYYWGFCLTAYFFWNFSINFLICCDLLQDHFTVLLVQMSIE